MHTKTARQTAIINGADGPVAYFTAGKSNHQKTLRQKIESFLYRCRKKRNIPSFVS